MGNGNLAGTGAIWGTYTTDKGAAVSTIEYQIVAGDMTAVDGAAHHEGGQCAAVVDGAAEHGIFDDQLFDATVGVTEKCRFVGRECQMLNFFPITKIGASESGG